MVCFIYLRYPTNIKLLWESVERLYKLIGHLCKQLGIPLPCSKYLKWKKRYVSYSKMKRKTRKNKSALTRSLQLLLSKFSNELDRLEAQYGIAMTKDQYRRRATAKRINSQQHAYFYRSDKPKARIVSLDKDYIQPIVRGKKTKTVEVGARSISFSSMVLISSNIYTSMPSTMVTASSIRYLKRNT